MVGKRGLGKLLYRKLSEAEGGIAIALLYISLIQIGGATSARSIGWLLNWDVNLALPVWLACYTVALLGLSVQYRIRWMTWFFKRNRLLSVLLIFTCLSLIWSVDKSATLKRVVHLVGISVIAIYIGSNLSFSNIIRHSVTGLLIVLGLSAAVALFYPEFGLMTYDFDWETGNTVVWRGFAEGKNALGITSVVGIFFGTALIYIDKTPRVNIIPILLIGVSLLVLWKADSATSIASFVISGFVVGLLVLTARAKFSAGLLLLLCSLVLVVGLIGSYLFEFHLDSLTSAVTSSVGRSDNLTGRIPLWEKAWDITLQQPLLGFGYGTIWGPAGAYSQGIYNSLVAINWEGDFFYISHAHNGFLNVSTQMGIPFAVLAIGPIVFFAWHCIDGYLRRHNAESLLLAGFTAMFIAYNVAEVSLFYSRNLLWILFLVFVVNVHFSDKKTKRRRKVKRSASESSGKRRRSKQRKRKKRKTHDENTDDVIWINPKSADT